MNTPLAVRIECAKGEILNAMETIQKRHALPPCIMDGVLSSVLAEVRSEAKIELINSTNTMMAEKNEELERPLLLEGSPSYPLNASVEFVI